LTFPSSSRFEPHVLRIAVVIVLGAIMSVLDTTIVNVALDTLSQDLGSPLDSIQWVVTGYLLSLAAVIPITGWAARRFGSRRLYIASLALFTIASALCGLAWSTSSLIGFRVLQGVAGGMIMPIGQMILVKAVGPKHVGRIMGIIGVPIVLAPVFGPTLGGLLVQHAGWEWIFLVNVPIGILAVIAGLKLLPADTPEEAGKLDAAGLALVTTGVVGVTYGLAESGTAGSLTAGRVVVPLVAGLALVGLFVLRALRIERPLLDVRLYANKAFAAASVSTFCLGAALFGAMILMPLYFQTVRGEDAVHTGLLLAPQGIGAALAMVASGRATERFGGGPVALAGGVVAALGTLPFVLIGAGTSYWLIGAAMVVRGFGIGMSFMPAMTAAFAVLRPDQVNDASPQLNTLQRVGGSIGTAILTVVLQGKLDAAGATPAPAAAASAFGSTYWWVLAVTLAALVPAAVLTLVERRARATAVPAPLAAREAADEVLEGVAA
jgi:EmrB/QacA subfamily drug resistance transporter